MPIAKNTINDDLVAQPALLRARAIPPLSHREAVRMATSELERFLAVVTSLSGDDWEKSTACTSWNVRQILAHVTGAAASYARWSEFKRQGNPKFQRPYRANGLSFLDSMNQIQVDDRASATPEALIDELQRVGPRAIATRARLPWLLRTLRVPLPALGFVPIDYLTDLIYTRDMWMHRLDLCRATGHEMIMTSGHDGRIVALVMRDLEKKLAPKLRTTSIVYHLSGSIGGVWQLGAKVPPVATIKFDVLDFNLLASGRLAAKEVFTHASVEGDSTVAHEVLNLTSIPY